MFELDNVFLIDDDEASRLWCTALELLGAVVETEAAGEWFEVKGDDSSPAPYP